jgi:hypothetical protein
MGKKKKKLCYSVVPTAAGEALYKQLKSTTALQNLGVGDDMLEHKGTSELLDTAVKAVEKAKKEKENKRTRKIKKMLRCPVVVVTSPRPRGKTTGVVAPGWRTWTWWCWTR